MQQFHVPQFIEVEDKIFGPLTIKQFLYLIGGAGIIFIFYVFLNMFLVILLGIPIAALFIALAFLKINGQPFIKIVGNALNYASGSRLYIWKKEAKLKSEAISPQKTEQFNQFDKYVPKLSENKLQDLAWSLDIKEKLKRE